MSDSSECGVRFTQMDINSAKLRPLQTKQIHWTKRFWLKLTEKPKLTIDRPPVKSRLLPALISFFGAFIGLLLLSTLHYAVLTPYNNSHNTTFSLFIYSFGASAVLLYDLPESPAIQPRNILGNVISAVVGVTFRLFLFDYPYLSGPLAAAISIGLMRLSGTMHPPGGATALIAALSHGIPMNLSAYFFVLMPVIAAHIWLVFWAIVVNNLTTGRQYPHVWW